MKFGLDDKVIKKLEEVFEANPKVDKAIIFGSRAKGNYRPDSDIDIAIKGFDLSLDDILKMGVTFEDKKIKHKIDLIDYNAIKEKALTEHIDRVGMEFYSRWKESSLGDLIDIKHGYAFAGKNITDLPTKNILVTPGNFNIGGGFKDTKLKYFNSDPPKEYILKSDDIVVTMTDLSQETDTLGYSAKIPESKGINYLHNQRIGLVKLLSEAVDKDFIYWLLRTDEYQSYIVSSASGTSIMHTSPTRIKEFRFFLPPIKDQIVISSILNCLDIKINLIHRQNQTLEQLAETLFRQWFVEEAEESWVEMSLFDAIDLIGGGTPKTDISEYWNGNIGWLSGGDIASNHKSFVLNTEKSISESGLQNSSAKLLPKFSTVISARGTVGKYCLLGKPMTFSQSNYGIQPRYKNCFFFTYLLVAYSVDELQSAAYGSVFDTITTNTFKEHKVMLPENSIIQKFETLVQPYFEKLLENQFQIQMLTKIRDTLLPKLMSGEIRVNMN